jgi:hypothetical protein
LQKALWYLLHEIHADVMVVDYIMSKSNAFNSEED